MLKFLIMAAATLVDKIFQAEFHPARQAQALSRATVQRKFYRKEIHRR